MSPRNSFISFAVAQIDKLSQINKLSAIWAARFADASSSSVCSDSGTPQTRIVSCLGNLYQVSFSAGYERLHWLLCRRSG
jgi:hypothetical protein